MKTWLCAVAVAVLASTGASQALTISVQEYDATQFASKRDALASYVVEDFEKLSDKEINGPINNTAVGNFSGFGANGAGDTVGIKLNGTDTNDPSKLALRNRDIFSRSNITAGGKWFLDSNDKQGMRWDVLMNGGASAFDTILFVLTDATDQGATLKILAKNGVTAYETVVGKANGNAQMVLITFSEMIFGATVELSNFKGNVNKDGFGVDDMVVGASVVPLPAPALLLMGGLAGLAAFRRKRAAA